MRGVDNYDSFYENINLKPHNLRHLENSLNIEVERIHKIEANEREFKIVGISIFLAVMAMYIGIMSRDGYSKDSTKLFDRFTTYVMLNPLPAIFFTLIMTSFVGVFLSPKASKRVLSFKLVYLGSQQLRRYLTGKIVQYTKRVKLEGSPMLWGRLRVALMSLIVVSVLGIGIIAAIRVLK